MANAKKCDRCGEFYLENNKAAIVKSGSKPMKTLAWVRLFNTSNFEVGTFDLCDDCAKKLYEFLCNE